jgi:citrate lyase subunit beta/citryl-CoA lyase
MAAGRRKTEHLEPDDSKTLFFFSPNAPTLAHFKSRTCHAIMRSKLFVPASRPELFAKALASDADALSFDLEDAVAPARKEEARASLAAFLRTAPAQASDKVLIVRINPAGSPWFMADLEALVGARLDLVNLPKPESADAVRDVAAALAKLEAARGIATPLRLLLNIETPRALRLAHELACADPRVAGLQLGYADLFLPLGIVRHDAAALHAAMFQVRMAAGEAGIYACDAAFADVRDTEGFKAEAAMARALGFVGKSCIHPSQVALANAAFRPSDAEIEHARRVVQAAAQADAQGLGVYLVDGKMIDAPFVARARDIMAQARRLQLGSMDHGDA